MITAHVQSPLSAESADPSLQESQGGFDFFRKVAGGKAGAIGFGRDSLWRISPGFRFETLYDSNINREAPGKRDEDIILTYTPSVEINRYGTRVITRAGYDMRFQEFLRDTGQTSFNHDATVNVKFASRKLKAELDERFSWLKTYATSEQSERRTIMVNTASPSVEYRLTPKFSVGSFYQNTIFDYKDSALEDRSYLTHDIGGRIYYRIRPKLNLFVHGSGILVDYYRSSVADSKGYSVGGGTTGRLTKKMLLDVQTGFKNQIYDDRSINSFDHWVVRGVLYYRVTPKISAFLTAIRDKQESVYRNTNWYEGNRLGLDLTYKLTRRITATLNGSLQRNRYSRETTEGGLLKKRRDYIVKSGINLEWRLFHRLFVSAGYNMHRRFSNFDNVFDYVTNSVEGAIQWRI